MDDYVGKLAASTGNTNSSLGEHIQVYLTRGQILMLARCANNERKKAERRLAKSNFVPEEGKRHGDVSRIRKMEKLVEVLLSYAEVKELDAGDPRRAQHADPAGGEG